MSSPKDVEMTDAPKPTDAEALTLAQEIEQSFVSLQKAVATFDNRFVSKVFRDLGELRRKIAADPAALAAVIAGYLPDLTTCKASLLAVLPQPSAPASVAQDDVPLPEIIAYMHLLVQIYLLDAGKLDELAQFNEKVVELLASYNRRTLDFLQAKIWFYVSRTSELRGELVGVRPALLKALRSATLRHDDETIASVVTLLLRNYILSHDISQAANLCDKITFPPNASNALAARYYYYLARINAVQLDYSTAHECVTAAIRKAPQTKLANGFLQEALKLNIIIELLMGDTPSLSAFRNALGSLEPYFLITKAVRSGDLKMFAEVLKQHESLLLKENNYTLVSRLHQNVIKTGIRLISLAYSQISLKDICIKLNLDSEEALEYIVLKAIRDGVIEATVDHEQGIMKSKELLDVYSTKLPQEDFDQRIRFCLSLNNDSVKAMRYPQDEGKNDTTRNPLDSFGNEAGLLQAIEDGDLDDFME